MRTVCVLVLGLALCSCAGPSQDDARAEAIVEPHQVQQSIYYGGDILTMAGHEPEYAEAVVEGEGEIIFVGSKEDALAAYRGRAREVDLEGRTVLPGFNSSSRIRRSAQ